MILENKTAIITGGSRGIGRAAAFKLAAEGADIAIIYANNENEAQFVCSEIKAMGRNAAAWKADVADFAQTKETVQAIAKKFGKIDILVNCAGITKDGLIAMMKEADFDDVIDVNLKGTFNMIKHCMPYFIKQRSGKIVNVSSVSGITGNAGQANYSASKAGIIGLTKSTAKELASRGICCNAAAPGFIETDMTAGLADNPLIAQIPMKRMGTAQEAANLIFFLSSPLSDYITGEVIKIDGGIAM